MFVRMGFRFAILLSLFSFTCLGTVEAGSTCTTAFQGSPGSAASIAPKSATTMLTEARQLAGESDFEQSFALLSRAFPAEHIDAGTANQVLSILITIIEGTDVEQENEFSNRVYDFAKSFAQTAGADQELGGHGKLESAYPFMQILDRLATVGVKVSDANSAELFLLSGQIARNLVVNPTFPIQAKPGIAGSLFMEARGYALQGNLEKTTLSLRQAYEWGFVDFHAATEDAILKGVDANGTLKGISETALAYYKSQVRQRVRSALANFPRYRLEYSLQTAEPGKLVTQADYRNEIVVLDLGASWCAPCVKSIPHLKRLQEEFADQGVKVLNASFENGETDEENRELLKKFIDQHEIEYDVALGSEELKGKLPNFRNYPTLVFVDRLGNVRYSASGYHDYTQISTIVELLIESDSVGVPTSVGIVYE